MNTPTAFWDRVAEKYAKSPIKDMASYEYTLKRTRSYLSKEDYVLEIGCGTGSTALLIAPDVAEILSTDISPEMVRIAKAKLHESPHTNVSFAIMAETEIRDVNVPISTVMALNFLHLVASPQKTIEDIAHILPTGGLFISKTACLRKKAWLYKPMIKVMQLFAKAPYVGFMSVAELDAMIEKAGFEIVETENKPASTPSRYIVARKR
jgi:ubiquinone/menaquinone biosynthesis C-methylase UbiE